MKAEKIFLGISDKLFWSFRQKT